MKIPQTVFVVDDDEAVRTALKLLLVSEGYQVEDFSSAEEFLNTYEQKPTASCLVSDVQMNGLDGIELQERLSAQGIDLPIVFVTGHGDVPMAVHAVQHGAVDFLLKPFTPESLLRRVQDALSRDAATRQASLEQNYLRFQLSTLTNIERKILGWVLTGMSHEDIAAQLRVESESITPTIRQLLHKLDASSVSQLAQKVAAAGLQDLIPT